MHQSVVEARACSPWEPDKRRIGQVAQAEFLESCERMSFGQGQLDLLPADGKLVQIRIGFGHEIDEPCIQSAGSYRVQLFETRRRLKLQIHIGLLFFEMPRRLPRSTLFPYTPASTEHFA